MSVAKKTLVLTALGLAAATVISGCSILPGSASHGNGPYPQKIDSPYGSTTIKSEPKKIAVTSSIDLDIAIALGADPVIAPAYSSTGANQKSGTKQESGSKLDLSPWASDALDDAGMTAPDTYDAQKGPDLTAIKEAQPDVILATGLDDAGSHFDELSDIAPVVAAKDDATWTDRTAAIATALNQAKNASAVVNDVTQKTEDVAAHHLELEDTTYAVADVKKSSIDYLSYDGTDDSLFTGLGLLPDAAAKKYSSDKHSVTKSNVDDLDADILLIHFPAGGGGMLEKAELADPFYREVKVIRGKHYSVLDDDSFNALTNPSPLSDKWALDNLPEDLNKAEQGVS